ncbi:MULTISPECIES: hypothetical protein [unclassified Streptomyces]|uniref:hypothetical protein n=1 Tax=unclassified Streptomyces TaxID=2593676 RepID=UPI003669BF0D
MSGETAAVEGLRTAVGFYSDKAARLRQQRAELEKELAAVESELAKAVASRDHLASALDEITVDTQTADPRADQPEAEGVSAARSAEDERSETGAAPDQERAAAAPRNRQLGRQVLQVLATAGRPLRAKEITEAIGRPISGKVGAAAIETTRKTCKRHVRHGRAVEPEPGVFKIAAARSGNAKGAA